MVASVEKVGGLTSPREAHREETYSALREELFAGERLQPEAAVALVPALAQVTASTIGAGRAAALLLEVVFAARRDGHDTILAELGSFDINDPAFRGALAPAIRGALDLAQRIRTGMNATETIVDEHCDAAIRADGPVAPTAADVLAWCDGSVTIGDRAPDSVVSLLVEVAFAERPGGCTVGDLEERARHALHFDRKQPDALIMASAHRAVFHAVLAWRAQRVPGLPSDFPAHREEERAVVQWILAMDRDHSIRRHLIGLAGCATLDEVRERERAYDAG